MSTSGFVKKAWIPEIDVLPQALVKKNPHFNPDGVCMPKGVDINSSLGRAILERQQNMAYEHNEGKGSLFVNDKGDNPSRPDRTGTFKLGGKNYKVSGWIKESTDGGSPWLSLSIQEDQAAAPTPKEQDSDAAF